MALESLLLDVCAIRGGTISFGFDPKTTKLFKRAGWKCFRIDSCDDLEVRYALIALSERIFIGVLG